MEEPTFSNLATIQQEESEGPTIGEVALARKYLTEKYGIFSEYVRVKTLAKILGLSSAAIYLAIREKRFFLPHRIILSSPVVKIDDLAIWHCRQSPRPEAPESTEELAEKTKRAERAKADKIDRLVERTLAQMGLPSSRRTKMRR